MYIYIYTYIYIYKIRYIRLFPLAVARVPSLQAIYYILPTLGIPSSYNIPRPCLIHTQFLTIKDMDETKCFRTIYTFKAHVSSLPLQKGRPVVLIDTPTSKMKIVAGYLDQNVNWLSMLGHGWDWPALWTKSPSSGPTHLLTAVLLTGGFRPAGTSVNVPTQVHCLRLRGPAEGLRLCCANEKCPNFCYNIPQFVL